MTKKHIKTIVLGSIGAVLFIICTTGIVFLVAQNNQAPTIFLYYQGDKAIPVKSQEEGIPFRWCNKDLKVGIKRLRSAPTENDLNSTEFVINEINNNIGLQPFSLKGSGDFSVIVEYGHFPDDRGLVSDIVYHGDNTNKCVTKAIIRVKNVSHVRDLHRVLMHSFGHVLGLDDNPDGYIMSPNIKGDHFDDALHLDRFSDSARDYIRKNYEK